MSLALAALNNTPSTGSSPSSSSSSLYQTNRLSIPHLTMTDSYSHPAPILQDMYSFRPHSSYHSSHLEDTTTNTTSKVILPAFQRSFDTTHPYTSQRQHHTHSSPPLGSHSQPQQLQTPQHTPQSPFGTYDPTLNVNYPDASLFSSSASSSSSYAHPSHHHQHQQHQIHSHHHHSQQQQPQHHSHHQHSHMSMIPSDPLMYPTPSAGAGASPFTLPYSRIYSHHASPQQQPNIPPVPQVQGQQSYRYTPRLTPLPDGYTPYDPHTFKSALLNQTFDTKDPAIEYIKTVAKNFGFTVLVRTSKPDYVVVICNCGRRLKRLKGERKRNRRFKTAMTGCEWRVVLFRSGGKKWEFRATPKMEHNHSLPVVDGGP
ncbi:hypothetical protein SpCBS45565_g08382 [Spizellomyces sp. 'palustris']|nr:hypothetical protein SpCBS45565_g08382 [Spizellomyces sp. 'palustris']